MLPSLKSKILVAMSGGVDSCVTAAILAEQGHDVVGVTMRVTDDHEYQNSVFQPCCSARMANDARQVAERFGFPHYTLNLVDNFQKQVIDDFTGEYASGRTPNPCVRCNQRLKFGALYKKAVELEASHIATGHYVRLARRDNRHCVQRAVHTEKDQSYVMAGLSQKQLAMGIFPLGTMTKAETRAKAREYGLAAAETPESQDICFIPDNDYKGFLRRRIGAAPGGPIVSTSGEELGTHSGLTGYTIGQRKGLGIASERPLYVVRIDQQNNALVVGHEEESFCLRFFADEVTWGGIEPQTEPFRGRAQIRYRHRPSDCTVYPTDRGFDVEFDAPERAVTPGQWAVIYDDEDRVLAASLIRSFETAPIQSTALQA